MTSPNAAQQKAPELLSFGAYARRRGVSQQRVSQLIAEGRLPVVFLVEGDPRSRRINPEAADRAFDAMRAPEQVSKAKGAAGNGVDRPIGGAKAAPDASNNAPGKQGAGAPGRPAVDPGAPGAAFGVSGSFAAARTSTEQTRQKLLEVQLRREVGELVEVDSVVKAIHATHTAIAKTLDTMPDRLAGVLASETDPRKVRELLATEVRNVRMQVATTAEAMAAEPQRAAL